MEDDQKVDEEKLDKYWLKLETPTERRYSGYEYVEYWYMFYSVHIQYIACQIS